MSRTRFTVSLALLTSHFEREESPHVCMVGSTNPKNTRISHDSHTISPNFPTLPHTLTHVPCSLRTVFHLKFDWSQFWMAFLPPSFSLAFLMIVYHLWQEQQQYTSHYGLCSLAKPQSWIKVRQCRIVVWDGVLASFSVRKVQARLESACTYVSKGRQNYMNTCFKLTNHFCYLLTDEISCCMKLLVSCKRYVAS